MLTLSTNHWCFCIGIGGSRRLQVSSVINGSAAKVIAIHSSPLIYQPIESCCWWHNILLSILSLSLLLCFPLLSTNISANLQLLLMTQVVDIIIIIVIVILLSRMNILVNRELLMTQITEERGGKKPWVIGVLCPVHH